MDTNHADDSSNAVLHPITFPDEIVEDILIRAWMSSSWSTPKSRWLFYCKILGLSRQWNRIVYSVIVQYRCLETLADFQLYNHLCPPTGTLEETEQQPRCKYLRIPYNDMALSYLYGFKLHPYLVCCDELDVIPMYDGKLWTICRLLVNNEHVRALSFDLSSFAVRAFPDPYIWPHLIANAPTLVVTTLSINTQNIGWFYRDILDFKAALTPFPKLAHLRTNVPVSLLLVSEYLRSLVTLTLDIPPLYLKDFHATSLLNWSLISALKKGAFQPKKITVESGPLKPIGWDELCKICDTLGVVLIYSVKYPERHTLLVTNRVKEAKRNLEAASVRFDNLPIGDRATVSENIDRHIDRYHAELREDPKDVTVGTRTSMRIAIRF
ncbi:hypothetical protein EUX98_g4393 [Antrodiella citrinella]|uniref:Uncharacterized protein n=1 Tax=Antrodiella citrinella TaxID=2447956 RepID=A0A4S4MU37_9APHY|nr:hypothetical protein EUX98_g4393 [Antrodiella citrinella]